MQNLGAEKEELVFRAIWWFAIITMVVYLLPYVLFGANGRWMIWDNLDGGFVIYKILLESGTLFDPNSATVLQPLGGVPRGTLPSEFDVFVWLYYFLGPEAAYITNRLLQSFTGFAGMYLLLKRHVFLNDDIRIVFPAVSLCFAILPFWPFGGLSVAGMPLVLFAVLNIRAGDSHWYDWFLVLLYPFYSSLVLSGVFLLLSLAILWLFDVVRKRRTVPFFYALLFMSMAYILTNYRLFQDFLIKPEYISHRVEFGGAKGAVQGLGVSLLSAGELIVSGQPHALSLQWPVIIIAVFMMLCYVRPVQGPRLSILFFLIAFFVLLTSLFYGLYGWTPVRNVLAVIENVVPMQLQRFYFLHPVLWMILFAIALSTALKKDVMPGWVALAFVLCQVGVGLMNHEMLKNKKTPTVSEFYAVEQFEDLAKTIGKSKDSYRVASLGLHPAIALYNGFYTIDGYWSNYPLNYKHKFRDVIAGELDRNASLRSYFDDWGSRAYIFSDELTSKGGYLLNYKGNTFVVEKLNLDAEALRLLGVEYIISSVQVNEEKNQYLDLVGKFENEHSAWDIYLYKIMYLPLSMHRTF